MRSPKPESIGGKTLADWFACCPPLADAAALRPTFWINNRLHPFKEVQDKLELSGEDVNEAAQRLERFRPYIAQVFPETAGNGGRIESPLIAADTMRGAIWPVSDTQRSGTLLVKLDSHLPISGSIKARGGIYEVLKFAETTAMEDGLLQKNDNYAIIDSDRFRKLFANFSIAVGSTGNLGLSIGIMGARLGFQVTVHMSADAREWKKDMLRFHGVNVVEYDADYGIAVARGRQQAAQDPNCHFVDDEDSKDLFLGYAVAAQRLEHQLAEQGIVVDNEQPLLVYLPCGVGGGPGGVAFGLKLLYGDNVYPIFCEPTSAPAMLAGMATGLHDRVCATELGIENQTAADGLAVSRPSGLVCRMMENSLSGICTVPDMEMFRYLELFYRTEGYRLEPSATVGFSAFAHIGRHLSQLSVRPDAKVTHLVWATGGSMVPETEWKSYLSSS